jgi:hypothetical protein
VAKQNFMEQWRCHRSNCRFLRTFSPDAVKARGKTNMQRSKFETVTHAEAKVAAGCGKSDVPAPAAWRLTASLCRSARKTSGALVKTCTKKQMGGHGCKREDLDRA